MILSAREIKILIRRGRLVIDPLPPESGDRWSCSSLDLHLAAEYRRWDKIPKKNIALGGDEPRFCPGADGYTIRSVIAEHTTAYQATAAQPLRIRPGDFVLGWTVEKVGFPHDSRVAARVEGKSSLARIGLGVHVTAPTIHAGFGGDGKGLSIQLEMWNVGPLPIDLPPGIAICQLIIEEVHGTPEAEHESQFVGQGPGK